MKTMTKNASRFVGMVTLAALGLAPELAHAEEPYSLVSMGFAVGTKDYSGTAFVKEGDAVIERVGAPIVHSGLRYDATLEFPLEMDIDDWPALVRSRMTIGLDLLYANDSGCADCEASPEIGALQATVVRFGMGASAGRELGVYADLIGSLNMIDVVGLSGARQRALSATRFDFSVRAGGRVHLADHMGIQVGGEWGFVGVPSGMTEVSFFLAW